ncbi:ABC transporter permease [Pseudolactococcus yaeyamensis]
MIRLMKADFYRLSKTVGLYMTLLAVVALGVLSVVSEASISVGVNVEDIARTWTLPYLMKNAVMASPILTYVFISIFIILIGHEFSLKTYKNSLTAGTSRLTFLLAKYVTELLVLVLATFLFFMAVLVAGVMKYGLAGADLFSIFSDMLLSSVMTGIMISVLFGLATLILISVQSSVLAAVFTVMYPLIMQITASVTKWENIKYFDFFGFAQMIGLNQLTLNESIPYLVVGSITILLSIVGSVFVIKHKEL